MAEDSDLERTEAATSKRLEKAREEGNIPRSRELGTCVMLLLGGTALWIFGGNLAQKLYNLMYTVFTFDREQAFDIRLMFRSLIEPVIELGLALLPIIGLLVIAAFVAPIFLGGWLFTMKSVAPKLSKLNPISGFSRLFSVNSLVELLKAVAKSILVGMVAWFVIVGNLEEVLRLGLESPKSGMSHAVWLMWLSFISIAASLILVAVIDVPYQKWSYAKKLRMTKQEIKEEHKESDGNPQLKGRIRALQREMAQRRMMAAVPTADVVVTNPTHYAVALKYTEGKMRAPTLVAKGADDVAAKIREVAREHKIPILEAPALARALHYHTDLDQEIPEALYTAVAEVLAYVFHLRMYNVHGGPRPDEPADLEVPNELDPLVSPNVQPLMAKRKKR